MSFLDLSMHSADVYYMDGNRQCGTMYFGIHDEAEALHRYLVDYPQHADKELYVKLEGREARKINAE